MARRRPDPDPTPEVLFVKTRMLLPVIALACLLALPAGASAAGLDKTFFGVVGDRALFDNRYGVDLSSELGVMRRTGVGTVRVTFSWAYAQRYRTAAQVPAAERPGFVDEGGVPTDWAVTDNVVRLAAVQGVEVLPVLLAAPSWTATRPRARISPPKDYRAYGRFVTAAVKRYGPNGRFWAQNPTVPRTPIRNWQVWNEPNGPLFWPGGTIKQYVALLKQGSSAIRRADRGAKVVLAGLFRYSPPALRAIYRGKARRMFDVVAIHPFTSKLSNVQKILRDVRTVMKRYRDRRKPLWLTELSWSSALGKVKEEYGFERTEQGQAAELTRAFTTLARKRRSLRLQRVYWYNWMGVEEPQQNFPFDYAGLRGVKYTRQTFDKPALAAYRKVAASLRQCPEAELATCR